MTIIYGIIIEVIALINDHILVWFIDQKNYRYKKDYNDALNLQLFTFNCVNYFVPMMFTAFYKQSYQALFTLMLTVIVFDQFKTNLTRLIKPFILVRPGLAKISKEWKEREGRYDENNKKKRYPTQKEMV